MQPLKAGDDWHDMWRSMNGPPNIDVLRQQSLDNRDRNVPVEDGCKFGPEVLETGYEKYERYWWAKFMWPVIDAA